MRVFGTLVKVCDSRKFLGCECELRIQVHKGKGISTNVVIQRAGLKCENQHKAMHWFTHHVFVSFFEPCFPLLLLKPANQKSSSTFFLVSNFLCSFRINLELLKAGDAMSSPAIVSLTELTHTFLLFETGSCCKKILGSFHVWKRGLKIPEGYAEIQGSRLFLRLSLHFITKSKRIILTFLGNCPPTPPLSHH